MVALRSHVADLQHHFVGQLLLEIQVIVFDIGSPDVAVEGKSIALDRAARSSIEWNTRNVRSGDGVERSRVGIRHLNRIGAYVVVRGSWRVKRRVGQVTEHHILRELVEKQSPSGTDDTLAFPGHVPRNADARGEVAIIRLVKAGQTAGPNHFKISTCWNEIGEQVVLLLHHGEVVPAQSIVEGHVGEYAIGVLRVKAKTVLISVPPSIARVVEHSVN